MWPNWASDGNIAIDFIMLVGSLDTLGIIVFVLILKCAPIFSVKQRRILTHILLVMTWLLCAEALQVPSDLNIPVTIKRTWWWWWRRHGCAVETGSGRAHNPGEHESRRGVTINPNCLRVCLWGGIAEFCTQNRSVTFSNQHHGWDRI